jgi:hypothetical protein
LERNGDAKPPAAQGAGKSDLADAGAASYRAISRHQSSRLIRS